MKAIEKRLTALESKRVPSGIPGCDLNRRLKRYTAYFEGRPWECTGTPERKAQREADLARYKRYFDDLEASVIAPRWEG